ncbi:MAG: undecaprenyl-diphosphatase [Sphaerochaeta sp.]|jgi:undecaprenyl-diphosphatase|uniref:Undecaprenyl-diphosphatase n=1 Tax=Sphaerochaeta halotolerans TaxID=2293840 RepID=A0A372MI40_9SPIR|nr:undecaprenyl-diphosphate phosphatase [Sphaerochaeta halotolerans]MDK2860416.1 undecaprenyl-diphosphatase [Sphaerochaeta sp.]RFU95429.1 undecaprenyl-diphosphate phosphatase [Sphaerochaeta halotolerans]
MVQEGLKSLLLGIVQGITEWLPISSTGHLLLLDEVMHLSLGAEARELFLIIIQLASILAVVILYFSTLNPFSKAKDAKEKTETYILWVKVLIATIPAGVIGILIDDLMNTYLYRWEVVAIALFVYGLLYIVLEKGTWGKRERRVRELSEITYRDALYLGLFQMLALIPGTSRSGSTILGGIIIGLERSVAAKFSFFMAIPVMAGASLLKLIKLGLSYSREEYLLIAIGSVSSFLVSLLCIKALVAYVRRHDFSAFGFYRIVLAVLVTVYFLTWGVA